MNREELPQEASREDKMRDALKHYEELATKACWHRSDIPDAIRAYYASLPPAESAVPDNAAEQNKRMREWFKERTGLDDTLLSIHMKQIDVMLKGVQQQPTAEGAEEILQKTTLSDTSVPNVPLSWLIAPESPTWNAVIAAMTEFATLHAQRIAEKMKEANQFILDIAGVLGIETDGVGFDGLTLSIDDFKEAADKMVEEGLREELIAYEQWMFGQDNAKVTTSYIKEYIDEYLKTREDK